MPAAALAQPIGDHPVASAATRDAVITPMHVHGGPNLEPLLFDDKRRLIPGGYRSSYRMVAIWQLDRLDDLGAANARAVAVEQVNGQQVREMSVIFTTDLHRFRSSSAAARRRVRLGRADTARELEAAWRQVHRHAPHRCASEEADRAN